MSRGLIRANQELVDVLTGRLDQAAAAYRESLEIVQGSGWEDQSAHEAMLAVGVILAGRGDRPQAALLQGAATANARADRFHDEVAVLARLGAILDAARRAHGPDAWDRERERGTGLSLGQAIDVALAALAPAAGT